MHVKVRGRVQGVGFRFFVQERADALGLAGWVRNSADGRTVELVAEGEVGSIEQLLADLNQGPTGSRVEQVDKQWIEPQGNLHRFEIRR